MDSSQREEGARGAAYRRPPLPGREFPLPCCGRLSAASGAAEMSMYSCSSPALLQEMRICGWKLMPPPLTSWLIWSPYFLGASRATVNLRLSTRSRATFTVSESREDPAAPARVVDTARKRSLEDGLQEVPCMKARAHFRLIQM